MSYTAALDGFGSTWESGKEIIDIEVTLGSGKSSNSCKVTLADALHNIGKALINHASKIGGIRDLIAEQAAATAAAGTPNSPSRPGSGSVASGDGIVARGGGWTPEILALADAVAYKESPTPEAAQSYYANNGIRGSMGSFTDLDIKNGGGFPLSAGRGYNVGRYQFKREDWEDAKKYDKSITGYTALDQDKVFYYKAFQVNRGGKEAVAGNLAAMQKKAGGEWASVPGSSQVQGGYDTKAFQAYYAKRLAFHKSNTSTTVPSPK